MHYELPASCSGVMTFPRFEAMDRAVCWSHRYVPYLNSINVLILVLAGTGKRACGVADASGDYEHRRVA